MARIAPLPAHGPLRRIAYAYARRRFGKVPEPMAVMAHHGGVLWADAVLESLVERRWTRLPARLRHLAELRASCVIGCPWCIDFGSHLARESLSVAEMRALATWEASDLFSAAERRVLAYTDAATATPLTVTDVMVAELVAELGDDGMVELAAVVALENFRSRFNHGLGITAQGYTSGDACALPV